MKHVSHLSQPFSVPGDALLQITALEARFAAGEARLHGVICGMEEEHSRTQQRTRTYAS